MQRDGKRVVEYRRFEYKCGGCKKCFVADKKVIPKKGYFGFNTRVEVLNLRYNYRFPINQIVGFLNTRYGVKMSDSGVVKILRMCAQGLRSYYNSLRSFLSKENVVLHIDETPVKINGVTYY